MKSKNILYLQLTIYFVLYFDFFFFLIQEFQSEVKNNTSKEENFKQEIKIQGIKVEGVQSNDKNESEKSNTASQSLTASSATVEANGIDNEDSINLTIGEDEENLLAEEVREKKITFQSYMQQFLQKVF